MDTASFRTQVVWVVVTFVGRFRVLSSDRLPAMDRATKVRARKAAANAGGSTSGRAETNSVEAAYQTALRGAAGSAVGVLTGRMQHQATWRTEAATTMSHTDRAEENEDYVSYRMELEGEKAVLNDMLNEVNDDEDDALFDREVEMDDEEREEAQEVEADEESPEEWTA